MIQTRFQTSIETGPGCAPIVGESAQSKHSSAPIRRTARLDGLRVLVVDDDRNTGEMLTEALQLYGAEVCCAASVAEAHRLMQTCRPHLTISDVGMPEEDGYDFIRKVRALTPEQGGKIPAIALTGYARPEDSARVLAAGYQLFMTKPVDLDRLVSGIEGLLEKSG